MCNMKHTNNKAIQREKEMRKQNHHTVATWSIYIYISLINETTTSMCIMANCKLRVTVTQYNLVWINIVRCEKKKPHQTHYEFLNKRTTTQSCQPNIDAHRYISIWSLLNAKIAAKMRHAHGRFTDKLKLRDTRTIKINMKWQKWEGERARN